eukprot:CAMPEP_0113635386 /NCGR_PEP_ID=MMETSP0017_2-20120614/18448_1 /TAXON_ID=2856 /ORGANISM="Cylindrotheca closterium" /LENGTH=650 /DNA_ID=CAMNT_0000546169 /DNA_START=200 /DNA_END=2149 /DNA_ORIENTATION=- /assembly_acc=CAM_ASM_000147
MMALAVPGTNGLVPSFHHIQSSTLNPCFGPQCRPSPVSNTARFAATDDEEEEDDDDDDDEDFSPEANMLENFASSSKKPENIFNDGKLGINLEIDPMTKEEAEDLRKEAKEMIEETFEATLKDIEDMREKAKEELAKSKESREFASQLEAQVQSQELMNKIDKLTGKFMDSTKDARKSTKLAAAADKATAESGQGVEMGTWGVLGDRNVLTDAGFLGSVESSKLGGGTSSDGTTSSSTSPVEAFTQVTTNRILVVADAKGDPVAKALLPSLKEALETKTRIPNLEIEVLSPTATMPLGANNAACILVFLPSLSQASSLQAIFDRLLRKTFNEGGQLGKPPTQLVAISTHGTTRYDQFPFNMQNMMGGGKLEKRSQIEEALIQTVRQRENPPPLDYTIIKVGEKNFVANDGSSGMQLLPGDTLEEATSVETATAAIVEAMAFQPFARNATLCLEGCVAQEQMEDPAFWDETFLPLEGPEVWRNTKPSSKGADLANLGPSSSYDTLVEYLNEWSALLAETGKGLTTPILAVKGIESQSASLMQAQGGVRLLFLPTNTGKNYMSREEEEAKKEKEGAKSGGSNTPAANKASLDEKLRLTKRTKEGGIDVVVEVTKDDQLRVRARRCNYADDAVLKELSEETILKRLQEALEVW